MRAMCMVANLAVLLAIGQASAQQFPAASHQNMDGAAAHSAAAASAATRGMALMSAVVADDGTLVRGAGAVSASHAGAAGNYIVDFARDVTDCTYTAMVGPVGDILSPFAIGATAQAGGNPGDPNGLFVITISSSGSNVNTAFHLMVFCAR
jgi:hypothetical protein